MKTAVTVNNLSIDYGANRVLKRVSFEVHPGEFFIVIGPNGSGKTTLIKALSGMLKKRQGAIEILGRAVDEYSRRELARCVAVLPQHVPDDLPFTVAEVVLMGRSPHLGMMYWEKKHDWELTQQAMMFANVEHLAGRKIRELSGGERQRVFIARALSQEPRLLLLDEPTASLDLAHQIHIMDLLERLREEKAITIIMVSHDLNLSAMYADRILLIDQGEVVSLGAPSDVFISDCLQEVFRCHLLVDENPLGKNPRITLVPGKYADESARLNGKNLAIK